MVYSLLKPQFPERRLARLLTNFKVRFFFQVPNSLPDPLCTTQGRRLLPPYLHVT